MENSEKHARLFTRKRESGREGGRKEKVGKKEGKEGRERKGKEGGREGRKNITPAMESS